MSISLVERGMAGVVFAIGEEQDKVSAGCVIEFAEFVEACAVDGVEDSCAADGDLPTAGGICGCLRSVRLGLLVQGR